MYRLLSLLLLLSITTCSQPHAHIDHILILRVCLPRVGKDFNAEACSAMLTLFENTMLISLRGQNVDFCVLAYVPHQIPSELRARLESYQAPFVYYVAPVTSFFEPGWQNKELAEAQEQYSFFMQNATQSPMHTRITTRVDIDDFMHRDYLASIQALHTYPRVNGVLVINQLRGYRMVFTPNPEDPATLQCHLSPMNYPFMATGQSLMTTADKTFSILNFAHTRDRFIPPLLESVGINATNPAFVVAVFKTVPLERGYIYVRHSLSHTHNFMEIGKDAVLCSEMADELHQGFALTNSNVLQIADCMHDRGSEL